MVSVIKKAINQRAEVRIRMFYIFVKNACRKIFKIEEILCRLPCPLKTPTNVTSPSADICREKNGVLRRMSYVQNYISLNSQTKSVEQNVQLMKSNPAT